MVKNKSSRVITMNSIIEIKIINNSFTVIETIEVMTLFGLGQTQSKWKPYQLLSNEPYGYSEAEIESWQRCREWLKTNHPELLL
jgi:hypothetical protein